MSCVEKEPITLTSNTIAMAVLNLPDYVGTIRRVPAQLSLLSKSRSSVQRWMYRLGSCFRNDSPWKAACSIAVSVCNGRSSPMSLLCNMTDRMSMGRATFSFLSTLSLPLLSLHELPDDTTDQQDGLVSGELPGRLRSHLHLEAAQKTRLSPYEDGSAFIERTAR
jgi:hypothetical protein